MKKLATKITYLKIGEPRNRIKCPGKCPVVSSRHAHHIPKVIVLLNKGYSMRGIARELGIPITSTIGLVHSITGK